MNIMSAQKGEGRTVNKERVNASSRGANRRYHFQRKSREKTTEHLAVIICTTTPKRQTI